MRPSYIEMSSLEAGLADADATVWYENGCDNQDYAPATTLLAMGLDADALPESYYTT